MRKVLIITYYWPPSGGSGVQRWVKFAKYLPSSGWQPVVYTPENPEIQTPDNSLEYDIPEEAIVIKKHITEFYSLYRSLTGGGRAGNGEVNPINSRKKSFLGKLLMAIRGNFFIPDPRISWVGPSVRFLKKYLQDNPVDIIVSTGPPHSMHLIAEKVARQAGVPWIADFRDPWTKIFYFKHLELSAWAERRHRKLEQRVLDRADAVVAVSPMVQDEFRAMTDTPVHLITNGFDEEDFMQPVEPDGYFNLTHTGLFASDGNPEVLWKVLADKCARDAGFAAKLRIRLVGKTDREIVSSIKSSGLGGKLVDLGYREHSIAVREQKNASVLILPLRKEPEYRATLPGKLFEYLAALKPILGIGQSDGAMAAIVNRTGAGVVFGWEDYDSVSKYIDYCWERFRKGASDNPAGNIEMFSRRAISRQMASLMDSLI